MSDVVGQIALELGIDSSQIVNQLTGASNKAAKQATSIFSGMGKKIAAGLSIAAFTKFTKDCLEVGSNITEVQNVVDTAFKGLSGSADEWASNAMTNFGLSELSAKKYMGVFGQMNDAMGITGKTALDMAENVTGLTGDVASFYNLGTNEAYTKLKSIWTGETETLKDLGVVMTQTNLDQYALNNGFGKTTAKMTEQEKVMLRYQYVTSALSNATGDFVKTQDSWANQTRILSLRFEQLKASLGKGFIALFTPILRGLNTVLAGLQKVADGFATFTQMLTGADISSSASAITGLGDIASDTADNVSGIGDAASSTAKQIEKSLAGFDQIEKLSEPTDSSSSSGGGTSSGGISVAPSTQADTTNAASAIGDFANTAKKELDKLRKWSVSTFSPSMSKIWDGLTKNTDTAKKNLTNAFNDIKALGPPLLNYFNGPFTNYLVTWVDTNGSILNGLFDSFNTVFSDVWNKAAYPILANFVSVGLPMLTDFASQTLSLNGTIFDTFKASWNSLWSEGVSPAIESISNVWIGLVNTMAGAWNEWGEPIFTGIKTAVKTTGDVFLDIWNNMLQPVWENALDVIDRVWSEHLQPLLKSEISKTYVTNNALSDSLSGIDESIGKLQEDQMYYTKTEQLDNYIKQLIEDDSTETSIMLKGEYTTQDSLGNTLKSYATTASLDLYIKKDPTSGELKSAIEAIADDITLNASGTINISGNKSVNINGNLFTLTSTNTTISADGSIDCKKLKAVNADLEGTFKNVNVTEEGITMTTTLIGGEYLMKSSTGAYLKIQGHFISLSNEDGTEDVVRIRRDGIYVDEYYYIRSGGSYWDLMDWIRHSEKAGTVDISGNNCYIEGYYYIRHNGQWWKLEDYVKDIANN